MGIIFDPANRIFHLQAQETSYVMQIVKSGYLAHVYWGRKVTGNALHRVLQFRGRSSFSPNPLPEDRSLSLDTLPQEYPGYGTSDFRHPAYQVQLANGSTASELLYHSHRIYEGKPKLDGLPATYVEREEEAQTLEIELLDAVAGLKVVLSYTVFERHNAIARSVRLLNDSGDKLRVGRVLSMSVDFPEAEYDFVCLSGAWARERHIERQPLGSGVRTVESRRGSSSHQLNPFIALAARNADEDHGDVYGFSLVYSGSFTAQAEVDQFFTTRVTMGINPFDFEWLLEPGESFQAPEVVLVHSCEGFGEMSRTYHKLYRERLCRGQFRDRTRPVLINNWEATYFDFDADKIESIAHSAKELGIELFVLDDGWFGRRNNDKSSLGDWFVNREKLPGGLEDVVGRVTGLGLQFGLWFEPEMVSPDSELYRKHPDWCLHVPDRRRTTARSQLILDYSRDEVCDAVAEMLESILSGSPITYVKWDMNRNMTEIGSAGLPPERQRETAHRYILGVYKVMERITGKFPHVLFESCSGGGGRFDPGILHYMPQTWTSDNTDAVERLKIQYGTSMVYPVSAMGAHVSAVPNHQVHRNTPLAARGLAAMSGNFGYELDLTKLSDKEKEEVKEQVRLYKEIRSLVQFGDFYRLQSPFEDNTAAWMFVSEDRRQAFVSWFKVLAEPNERLLRIKLKGLDPGLRYRLTDNGEIFGGDELMYIGLNIPKLRGDYQSIAFRLAATGN